MGVIRAFIYGYYSYPDKLCSYAGILTGMEQEEIIRSKVFEDEYGMKEYSGYYQGIMETISFIIRHGGRNMELYTDCQLFEKIATGEWNAETEFANMYLNFMEEKRIWANISVYTATSAHQEYMDRAKEIARKAVKEVRK